MKFPIKIKGIKGANDDVYQANGLTANCGDIVKVRPCGEKFGDKTYLGVFIGEVALSLGAYLDPEDGNLVLRRSMHNPMIFIPECNEVVWGCGSWWSKITSQEEVCEITDEDINNVWYVKAMKQLGKVESDDHNSSEIV